MTPLSQYIEVFIRIDSENRIIQCEGGNSFIMTIYETDWVKIDEGMGDKYTHCQVQYFDKALKNPDNTHNYIYEDGQVRETTDEEKEQERASFPKPELDETTITQEMLVDQEYRLTLMELGL